MLFYLEKENQSKETNCLMDKLVEKVIIKKKLKTPIQINELGFSMNKPLVN